MKHHLLACALALLPGAGFSHEFWIEPEQYSVAPGEEIAAHLRVGEEFSGSTFSYNPRSFSRFDFVQGDEIAPVPGRAGDRPAVTMTAPEDGLLVLAHETTPLRLTYKSMEKFEAFLAHKDWRDLAEVHAARGLPPEGFRERYTRHVKSMIAVGDGAGSDRALGLVTEIVALANPYAMTGETLPVQVLFEGSPRADAQVEVFEKAPDESVTVTLYRTDAEGIAFVPVTSGNSYLVDAVVIRAVEPEGDDTSVWESLWAGLTFAVP